MMQAISVRQPWIWSIFNEGKDIENRSRPTKVRGTIAIHASRSNDYSDANQWLNFRRGQGMPTLPAGFDARTLPRGGFVGVVDIVGCCTGSESKWFMGEFGYMLANPREIEMIPYPGQLGFFEVPPEYVAEINLRLAAHNG